MASALAGNLRREPRLLPDARWFSIDPVQLRNILNTGMGRSIDINNANYYH